MTPAGALAMVVSPFAGLPAIALEELGDTTSLQTRFDTKYVVRTEALEQLAGSMGEQMRVLEVDGRRAIRYRTTYFDTPDLVTYRLHAQRRRRRYKIRTRAYLEQDRTMLEVKVKDKQGRTVKHRTDHPGSRPDELPAPALAFVAGTLDDVYGFALPPRLETSAATSFWRTTLVDPVAGERLTIDHGLTAEMGGRSVDFDDGYVLLEAKAKVRRGEFERLLRRLGVRPTSVSKYCVSVTALEPTQPGNQWRPVLRKLYAGGL